MDAPYGSRAKFPCSINPALRGEAYAAAPHRPLALEASCSPPMPLSLWVDRKGVKR